MDVTAITVAGISLHAFNIAIIEFIKLQGINHKYCGIISMLLGLIEGVFLFSDESIALAIFIGLNLGLASTGIYTSNKNVKEGLKKEG